MKLSNPKTFEKWCEKNGFRAWAVLDDAERWANECDGTYGNNDIYYETGRRTSCDSPEIIVFDLVKPAIYSVVNEFNKTVGQWAESTDWAYSEDYYIDEEIAEPVYRFRN